MYAMLCFLGQAGGEQLNSFVGALRENGFALLGLLLQFVVRVATASLLIAWNCCWTLLEDAEMLSGDPLL